MTDLSELTAHYANIRRKFRELRPPAKVIPFVPKPTEYSGPATVIDAPIPVVRPYMVARKCPEIADIIGVVAEFYRINPGDILSDRRMGEIIRPRHVAMFLAKDMTLNSLPTIGQKFGHRDHTTILYAVRKIERLRQEDARLQDEIDLCRIKIMDVLKARNEAAS